MSLDFVMQVFWWGEYVGLFYVILTIKMKRKTCAIYRVNAIIMRITNILVNMITRFDYLIYMFSNKNNLQLQVVNFFWS